MQGQTAIFSNLLFALIALWIGMYTYDKYIKEASLDEKRFKLFALRDKLSIMAMKREIAIDSSEYIIMLRLINSLIKATQNFQVVPFLKTLHRVRNDSEIQEVVSGFISNIENHSVKLKEIYGEVCVVTNKLFGKRTKFALFITLMVLSVLMIISTALKTILSVGSFKREHPKPEYLKKLYSFCKEGLATKERLLQPGGIYGENPVGRAA